MTTITNATSGAPTLSGTAGSLVAVLDFCLVTTLGWTKPFSGTNLGGALKYGKDSGVIRCIVISDGRPNDEEFALQEGRALGRCHAGQAGVAEDAAFQKIHHIEGRADDRRIVAIGPHGGHRKADAAQRRHHPVFAVDLVGTGQQLARRLLAQHPATW